MCKKPLTFIQIKTPGEPKSKVKPISSATLEEQFKGKKLQIPCGKCASCQIAYSNQWANRTSLEAKEHDHNFFITLTYNNENLPSRKQLNKMTGEITYTHSINKQHLRKFIKNVRNYYYRTYNHTGIKFFGCGEYGTKNGRPHYHIIMFNLPIHDLKHKFNNKKGHKYYTSKIIENEWNKGNVIITDYSWNTGEYVARYICNRQETKWDPNWYRKRELTKEFISMSNGLGKKYLTENMLSIMDNDKILIRKNERVVYVKTFKYYLRLLEEKYGYGTKVQEIKDKRERTAIEQNRRIIQSQKISIEKARANDNHYKNKTIKDQIRPYEKTNNMI